MSAVNANESFMRWDPVQVSRFIDSLPTGEDKYGGSFLDNNIDGKVLPYLNTEHLKEIGIKKLASRLIVRRAIQQLIEDEYKLRTIEASGGSQHEMPLSIYDRDYVSHEALQVTAILLQDIIKKLEDAMRVKSQGTSIGISDVHQLDMKKLNENFNKLKTDLIPIVRLIKESKPLPTPTLDPGHHTSQVSENTGTSNINGAVGQVKQANHGIISRSNSVASLRSNTQHNEAPTVKTNRFSSGSILSMGTGKVAHHSSGAAVISSHKAHPDLNKLKPKLVQSTSSNSVRSTSASRNRGDLHVSNNQPMPNVSASHSTMEPLKQLRASSEDSCLKILQQAMKRHHISRSEWLKYVLVICYGDRERILKLSEKPVLIFKELQESGKHPAIMLRQLALTNTNDEEDTIYEDSRIGDDIPGGSL